jgi:hypothetical protein
MHHFFEGLDQSTVPSPRCHCTSETTTVIARILLAARWAEVRRAGEGAGIKQGWTRG